MKAILKYTARFITKEQTFDSNFNYNLTICHFEDSLTDGDMKEKESMPVILQQYPSVIF